jgi:hypothetical protein
MNSALQKEIPRRIKECKVQYLFLSQGTGKKESFEEKESPGQNKKYSQPGEPGHPATGMKPGPRKGDIEQASKTVRAMPHLTDIHAIPWNISGIQKNPGHTIH